MHPIVYQEFERICSERRASGAVLEVGALPSGQSLLCMRSLAGATEKIGVNLDGPYQYRDFRILKGNGNSMEFFENERFDVVLCNATLEHDKFFWKTIAEIKRVTKPGGLIVIGVPGFTYHRPEKVKTYLCRIPGIRRLQSSRYLNMLFTATITFEIHSAPGDYYRFSPQACKEVLFEGLQEVEIRSIMLPPRLIGAGRKGGLTPAT